MCSKKMKFLTLHEKGEILESFKKGVSVTNLSKKFGVAKSTICSINKKRDLILKRISNAYSGPGKRKTLRSSKLPKMEKCLYRWFIRMKNQNWPVSGLMLKEKAMELHSKLKENEVDFSASDGWLSGFKKRYGIRLLKISAEKISSQPHLVDPFKETIEKLELCKDQLYNCTKCWDNIISFFKNEQDDDNIPLSVLREKWDSELQTLITSTKLILQSFNTQINDPLSTVIKEECNEDDFLFNTSQNNEDDQEEDDEVYVKEENVETVSSTEAVESFNKILEWCANEGVDQSDINVLGRLRENAVHQTMWK